METTKRTIAKTVSWRIIGIVTIFLATYLLGGTIQVSIGLTVINLTVITLLYYFHERVWQRISWGYEEDDKLRP